MSAIDDIKDLLKKDKLIIGTDITLKALKAGEISKVFMAKNCSEEVKVDLEHYGKLSGVELIELDITNDELSVVCKKPFNISIIGLKK